jgi:hypothetical protein
MTTVHIFFLWFKTCNHFRLRRHNLADYMEVRNVCTHIECRDCDAKGIY